MSKERPRLGIVGAGAVGSLLASCLALARQDVTLADRRTPGGVGELLLVGPDDSRRLAPVTRVPDAASLPADLDAVVLAVKQFDVAGATDALAHLPGVTVVTVQNGVGAEEAVLDRRPSAPLIAASLTAATELGPPPEVRWLRRGGIGLAGVRDGVGELVSGLAAAFGAAGLPAVVHDDAAAMKWSKLLANLVGNASSALLDMDPAEIYAQPALFDLERRQLLEAERVMRALGLRPVPLPAAHAGRLLGALRLPGIVARPILARAIGGARGGKSPSLRLHVRGGSAGPTEVRWLNGAVAEAGARVGVRTPVNARLAALVEEAAGDPARAAWFARRSDRLLAAVEARDGAG